MATDKPRYSITVDNELLKAIEDYQFENRIGNKTQATIDLVKLGVNQLKKKTKIPDQPIFNLKELAHLEKYAQLNGQGQQKATNYVNDLLEISAYQKKPNKHGKSTNQTRELPLFNYPVSAGIGVFVGEGDYDTVSVYDDVPYTATFGVRIKGDSMEPEIPDGSIVWVKQQQDVNYGEVCIVVINDEGFCKIKTEDGFASYNDKYETIGINEWDTYRITGKVVYIED